MKTENIALSPARMESEAETELIAAAQRGDEAAFEALFDKYKRYVYSLCLRVAATPAGAEELTRKTFLTAFRNIATVPRESSFFVCVHRAAVCETLAFLCAQRQVGAREGDPFAAASESKPQKMTGAANQEPCTNC